MRKKTTKGPQSMTHATHQKLFRKSAKSFVLLFKKQKQYIFIYNHKYLAMGILPKKKYLFILLR